MASSDCDLLLSTSNILQQQTYLKYPIEKVRTLRCLLLFICGVNKYTIIYEYILIKHICNGFYLHVALVHLYMLYNQILLDLVTAYLRNRYNVIILYSMMNRM